MVVPAAIHCASWMCVYVCGFPSVFTAIHNLGVVSDDRLMAYAVAEQDFVLFILYVAVPFTFLPLIKA